MNVPSSSSRLPHTHNENTINGKPTDDCTESGRLSKYVETLRDVVCGGLDIVLSCMGVVFCDPRLEERVVDNPNDLHLYNQNIDKYHKIIRKKVIQCHLLKILSEGEQEQLIDWLDTIVQTKVMDNTDLDPEYFNPQNNNEFSTRISSLLKKIYAENKVLSEAPAITLFLQLQQDLGIEIRLHNIVYDMAKKLDPNVTFSRKPATHTCENAAKTRLDKNGYRGINLKDELKSMIYVSKEKNKKILSYIVVFSLGDEKVETRIIKDSLRRQDQKSFKNIHLQENLESLGLYRGGVNPHSVLYAKSLENKLVYVVLSKKLQSLPEGYDLYTNAGDNTVTACAPVEAFRDICRAIEKRTKNMQKA